jgi:lipopolysaccharide transport system permease protein
MPTEETVYSPDPAVWHPLLLIRRMVRESWHFRQLVFHLVVRDLRAQYRQSLLGYIWAFIPAIATAVGFSLAREANVLRISETHVNYLVFVMIGTVLWQTFMDALNGPIDALNNFKGILNRIYLPPEIIVFAKVGEVVVNLSVRLILLAIVLVIYRVPLEPVALAAPLLLALFIVQATTIGLFLAPLSVLYHDVSKAIPVISNFWFLLTPVVYPLPQEGLFATVVRANPATLLLVTIRNVITGGPNPNFWAIAAAGLLSLLLFSLALIAFRVAMPFVVERSSA